MKSLYGQTVGTKLGEKRRIYNQDVAQVDLGTLYAWQQCKQIQYHGKMLGHEHRSRSYVKVRKIWCLDYLTVVAVWTILINRQ